MEVTPEETRNVLWSAKGKNVGFFLPLTLMNLSSCLCNLGSCTKENEHNLILPRVKHISGGESIGTSKPGARCLSDTPRRKVDLLWSLEAFRFWEQHSGADYVMGLFQGQRCSPEQGPSVCDKGLNRSRFSHVWWCWRKRSGGRARSEIFLKRNKYYWSQQTSCTDVTWS